MAPAPPAVPVLWRIAVGLAILGIGTSLAFMAMPGTTTAVRVVSGVACAACLVFVAVVWRQIGMNQKTDLAMEKWRAKEALHYLERMTKSVGLTHGFMQAIEEAKTVIEVRQLHEGIKKMTRVVSSNNIADKRAVVRDGLVARD